MQHINKSTEETVLSGSFGNNALRALIRLDKEDPVAIADVVISQEGQDRHLFRSVLGISAEEIRADVMQALTHLTNGEYQELLQFLKGSGNPDLKFIELDPETQLEISGNHISPTAVARDLGKDGSVNINHAFDLMLNDIVADPGLLQSAIADFEDVQQRDLGLINPETYAITYPDLSIRPVILDPFQEEKLARLVANVISAKIAIVNGAIDNPELRELFLSDTNEIGREVIEANFHPLPRHVRIRIDSHTAFEVGDSNQIETNGSEPQGDAVTSATLSLFKRTFARLFDKLGATPEQIENCFRELRLPLYRVADKIASVYQQHQSEHPDLPSSFNVGFFAWKHPTTRKPLSNISNAESEKSIAFITDNSSIKNGYSFDPFDIVRFQTLEDSRYHIPVITNAQGEEVSLHFIRRLYGNLSFTGPTWRVLKKKNPEVFFKFSGITHEQWNPEGRRIPEWMWMNPLNPCLTDKVLDAVITDKTLRKRFNVAKLIAQDLKRQDPSLTSNEARSKAKKIIAGCEEFIPLTKCLAKKEDGLYPGDTAPGGLLEAEIMRLKRDRHSWVIKLDSLGGYAGHGVFVGRSFLLNEIPEEIFDVLSEEEQNTIKRSLLDTLAGSKLTINEAQLEYWAELPLETLRKAPLITIEEGDGTLMEHSIESAAAQIEVKEHTGWLSRARDVLWPHLIDYALSQTKSLIQQYRYPQSFNPIRLSYDGSEVLLSIPTPHSVDVNVFAFGAEQSDWHSRGSLNGKTNITGGYGARMLVIPSSVARSMTALYMNLTNTER